MADALQEEGIGQWELRGVSFLLSSSLHCTVVAEDGEG